MIIQRVDIAWFLISEPMIKLDPMGTRTKTALCLCFNVSPTLWYKESAEQGNTIAMAFLAKRHSLADIVCRVTQHILFPRLTS